MTHGPVESSFTVYADFPSYTGGVYVQTSDQELGGHAIKIMGESRVSLRVRQAVAPLLCPAPHCTVHSASHPPPSLSLPLPLREHELLVPPPPYLCPSESWPLLTMFMLFARCIVASPS